MDNNLPPTEFVFSVDVEGEETKQKYVGQFRYKRLTIKEKLDSQKWFNRNIIEDKNDENITMFYNMLSALRHGVLEAPEWFVESDYGLNLFDFNVIVDVFMKLKETEASWIDSIKDKADKVKIVEKSKEEDEEEEEEPENKNKKNK